MANHASAIKRIRRNERARVRNRLVLTMTRTHIKQARTAIAGKDADQAREAVQKAISALDRAAEKGIIHPNNAARRKSRLMIALNETYATSA